VRELHVVALSSDGKHLVLATKRASLKGTYLVRVGPRLTKALNGELDADSAAEAPPPAESSLTPKEIQARLRTGQTPEKVARAAGVPVERVLRFYGPVVSERNQVIAAARDATLVRARRGPSASPLGASVTANLETKGISSGDEEQWSAHRRPDGSWVVGIAVSSRGKERTAQWTFQPASKELKSLDAYALALGCVDVPVSRRRRPAPSR